MVQIPLKGSAMGHPIPGVGFVWFWVRMTPTLHCFEMVISNYSLIQTGVSQALASLLMIVILIAL